MILNFRSVLVVTGMSALLLSSGLYARDPVYTVIPKIPHHTITKKTTAELNVKVTNNSPKTKQATFLSRRGIRQKTITPNFVPPAGDCPPIPFTLAYNQSCNLRLQVTGSELEGSVIGGPTICTQGSSQCYTPSAENSLVITMVPGEASITASATQLALITNGTNRQLVITNTDTTDVARNVVVSVSPALPGSSTISPTNCGSIAPNGGTCVITIHPGGTPSSTPNANGDTNPTILTIKGDNTNSVSTSVQILGVGNAYQGGFIYELGETGTTLTGKIVGFRDRITPTNYWSAGVYNSIWGIDELSTAISPSPNGSSTPPATPVLTNCDGGTDGACNSSNILAFYNTNPIPQTAANVCQTPDQGYSDWYLPALCEMTSTSAGSTCIPGPSVEDLSFLFNSCTGLTCLNGTYWTSTEYSGNAQDYAWNVTFTSNFVQQFDKQAEFEIRCGRAITP